MTNKRTVLRVEHKTIHHPFSDKINLGPYYGHHYTGPKCEKLIDILTRMEIRDPVRLRQKIPCPSSYKLKRPGAFEDPYLRDIFLPCWYQPASYNPIDNFFVFGFSDLDQYREWFDQKEFPEIKSALENAGFVLRKYRVYDPVYVGKAQAVFRLKNVISKIEDLSF